MSQRRNAPAGKGGAPAKRPGGPIEKSAPKAPILTPQSIGVVFGLVALIGFLVFYFNVVKKGQETLANIKNQKATSEGNITTYTKKKEKLKEAKALDEALKTKLSSLDYLFLADQNDLIPYYEDTFLRVLLSSQLVINSDTKLSAEPYTFQINMLGQPFNSLPNTPLFKSAYNVFKIKYIPETNGVPPPVLDTRPSDFLTPYTVTLEGVGGSYSDIKQFVKELQSKTNNKLITVHCLKNDDGKNEGIFRTSSEWKVITTVYFMNPEKPATGDEPPMKPGGQSC